MSTHATSTQNGQNGLSEKARRLFAAHDREVSQFRRERRSNTSE